LQVYEIPIGPL